MNQLISISKIALNNWVKDAFRHVADKTARGAVKIKVAESNLMRIAYNSDSALVLLRQMLV